MKINAVVLWLGMVWMSVGCTSQPSLTRYVAVQPDKAIGLEVTYREGSPEYSHPTTLTPEQLENILKHITVQPSSLLSRITGGASTAQEAFSEEQQDFFSQHFSTALSQATPLETVTFYWANPRGNGIWEITSGGLYLQGIALHLILPNFRHTVPAKFPPQGPRNQPLSQLGEPLYSLKAMAPVRQLSHNVATELLAPEAPHFVLSLNELAQVQQPSNHQLMKPSTSTIQSNTTTKQRLSTLEELRQEGLLTEEEYQFKRREILGDL